MNDFEKQVKAVAKTPGLKDRLYLVKQGVPFDVAFSLDDVEAKAFLIILAELDGHVYNYEECCFVKER